MKSLFSKKTKGLETTERGLESLKISEDGRNLKDLSNKEDLVPTLERTRKKLDLTDEEAEWLQRVVFKRRDPEQETFERLGRILKILCSDKATPENEERASE
jgi:hypothetical protein